MRGLELKLSLSIVLKTRLRSKRHCATVHGAVLECPAQCWKWLDKQKAAGTLAPERTIGVCEDGNEPRTPLAAVFNIVC